PKPAWRGHGCTSRSNLTRARRPTPQRNRKLPEAAERRFATETLRHKRQEPPQRSADSQRVRQPKPAQSALRESERHPIRKAAWFLRSRAPSVKTIGVEHSIQARSFG